MLESIAGVFGPNAYGHVFEGDMHLGLVDGTRAEEVDWSLKHCIKWDAWRKTLHFSNPAKSLCSPVPWLSQYSLAV